eukprot:TRINITY_DN16763_c0_g1_i1.p1 TRINITY_DN16763_c0_g1~~TRINITY_DN16763_c0_g1_i1.p1  ORF type:complete len:414 (+),score=49.71 TRINITY_DN16763_c0_g1_i1:51-1292(+)
MSDRASTARVAQALCREVSMSQRDFQSLLVDLGMPEQSASKFMDSVPIDDGSEVMTAGFMEAVFGGDGAGAAFLVQHGAAEVTEDDLASLASQPSLARASTSEVKRDSTCPCCLGGFWHPVKTPCGHAFCSECVRTWLDNSANKTCPMCRAELGVWRPRPEEVDNALERQAEAAFGNELQRYADAIAEDVAQEAATDARRAAAEADRSRQQTLEAAAALAERERIAELLAAPDAFAIRIGHRLHGAFGGLAQLYVEPVNKALPLHLLISHVRFELHPRQQVNRAFARGPKLEIQRCHSHVCPGFKVHIIWKEGLGMDPTFVRVDDLHDERARRASEIRVLRLCQFFPSREMRALSNQFREVFEESAARQSAGRLAAGDRSDARRRANVGASSYPPSRGRVRANAVANSVRSRR